MEQQRLSKRYREESGMHATFRQYDGIANPSELLKQATETFLPRMRDIPGYVSYYFVDVGEAGGRMMSISVFEDEAGTEESNRRAAEWVREHPGLIPAATSVQAGEVVMGG
jgi:hypothetical protein